MTRKRLILIGCLIGMVAACATRSRTHRTSEWQGLTDSEARSKLETKFAGKIPAEKRSAISDTVVAKTRDRGVTSEDPAVPDDASGLADDADQLAEH